MFQKLLSMIEKNYKGVRTALAEAKRPMIPYLGVYLQDLIFIDEGNASSSDNFFNFDKFRQIASVFQKIKDSQSQAYPFEEVPFVQAFLSHTPSTSEDELYEISIQLEARGSEPLTRPNFIERSYLQMKSSKAEKKRFSLKSISSVLNS